jgi:hypothetical protein
MRVGQIAMNINVVLGRDFCQEGQTLRAVKVAVPENLLLI